MRKLSIGAALVAAAIAVPLSIGSSHREAPNIALDPTADNTDTYAFTAKDAPGALTVVANWIPGEVPANGPNFFRFDDRARYYIHIDNTGDGKPDVSYRFVFDSKVNPDSYLQAFPGVESISDPKLYQRQTYDIIRETYKGGKERRRSASRTTFPSRRRTRDRRRSRTTRTSRTERFATCRAAARCSPASVTIRSSWTSARSSTRRTSASWQRATRARARTTCPGSRSTPSCSRSRGEGHARTARACPAADASNAVVGVWSTTERKRIEVTNADFDSNKGSKGKWVQVSRLGNPLVNEVVIPAGKKDKFNRTRPHNDAANYGKYVVEPELAKILNALFDIGAPETDRTDIVQALLQGLPGLNQQTKDPLPVDTLKLNLGVPPADTENRFGVIGGDNAGFPNGRRLGDDVVDIELQVVAGFLKGNKVPLGDGVDGNDKPFLSVFPYLAGPNSGFDSNPSNRIEPAHEPAPAGGGS